MWTLVSGVGHALSDARSVPTADYQYTTLGAIRLSWYCIPRATRGVCVCLGEDPLPLLSFLVLLVLSLCAQFDHALPHSIPCVDVGFGDATRRGDHCFHSSQFDETEPR